MARDILMKGGGPCDVWGLEKLDLELFEYDSGERKDWNYDLILGGGGKVTDTSLCAALMALTFSLLIQSE